MFELVIFTFFLLNTVYVLILSIAGHFYKKKVVPQASKFNRIAILVPSYKEDKVILHTTTELLKLDYPKSNYDVIVIADSLEDKTIETLKKTDAIVIPVAFEKSMKSRSLNHALNHIDSSYDIAIIADADNILSKNFLNDINNLFCAGYQIIQSQRVAKNLNTPMAMLDGVSEAINNHLFRQGSNALGLSAALIGSGMAFPYKLLKEKVAKIDSVVEDRELQLALLEEGYTVTYQKGILVYDEKVESTEAYKNQRKRWIAGQYGVLKKYLVKSFVLLFKGNINFFNSAFIQNVFPSRIISLTSLLAISIVSIFIFKISGITIRWCALTLIYSFALILSTPRIFFTKKLIKSLSIIPVVFVRTIQSLFQSRNASKTFIHTEHKQREIDSTFLSK
ncbi:MAG TPA: glycosyltransferase family 2 protein [Cyclobacteriaceae bacterium]|nr:glycosyltransferase family 2 protein [Cyclobacteriaceae bacterium]HRJ83489.1 glycosyltransferase family 2 protein [Cyclobacteriaceae bacterium]